MFDNEDDDDLSQEHGAPVEFGGPVYRSHKPVVISDDTDSGIPETRMPTGVRLNRGVSTGELPLDISNPPEAELSKDGLREASTSSPIARPAPRRSSVSLRGLNPASEEEPATPSLPAGSSPAAPNLSTATPALPTKAAPTALETQTAADRGQQAKLREGSGISKVGNPWARGALRGLNLVGSIGSAMVDPTIGAALGAIPGTEEHHAQLVGRNTKALNTDEAQGQKEAQTSLEDAQAGEIPSIENKNLAETEEARARAESLRRGPLPKEGQTPEEVTIHDLMTGQNGQPRINPQTKQPYTYLDAYAAVKQAAQDTKTDPPNTERTVRVIKGIPHEILIDKRDGHDIRDLGPTKVAGETPGEKRTASEQAQVEREARTSIRKAEGAYRDTQKSVGQLISAIDASQDGNGLLTAFAPTMEVLGINAANGVHRISPVEAQAANLPGGWAEQFNAWFDKASTGKLSPELQQEGKQLARILVNSAHQRYKSTYDDENGIASGYGIKDFDKRVPAIQGETTHFTEGTDNWDIPPDQLERFKKLHPNAKAD